MKSIYALTFIAFVTFGITVTNAQQKQETEKPAEKASKSAAEQCGTPKSTWVQMSGNDKYRLVSIYSRATAKGLDFLNLSHAQETLICVSNKLNMEIVSVTSTAIPTTYDPKSPILATAGAVGIIAVFRKPTKRQNSK